MPDRPRIPLRSLFILLAALGCLFAQTRSLSAQTDVIRGRVTGADGSALGNVRVTATSIPGNVTRSAQTNNDGRYQIAFPGGPGDYIMGFAIFGYAYRQFEIKRLADEDVLVADVRLAPIQLDSILVVAPQQQRVNRNQQTPDVSGTERAIPQTNVPIESMGDIAAMAASLPGVLLLPGLDGQADGFSVLGLGADQNNVTLNGLPVGSNGLPRDAAISSSLTTSPYDVSKGGFSGGNFNIRSNAGSNFRTRGTSLVMTAPQVQWTDRAAQALGNDYTNLSLSGRMSGPLKVNKIFYNVSYQLGRDSRNNQTLLSTSALGLQTAGVAMDSVNRFLGILSGRGIPTLAGQTHSNRVNDSGSVFGSIDLSPPSSSSGQSFGVTFNGNWRKQEPTGLGGGPLALESAAGDHTNWTGGIQARHSRYFGLILSESSAGLNFSKDYDNPYLDLPSGRVRVSSIFDDGSSGVQNLTFGGNQGRSESRSTSAVFQNSLSWFDNNNKHRIRLSSELSFSGNKRLQSSNLLGSFVFNSLEDLEAGRPASFSRTLNEIERSTGQVTGSLALGDSWRKTPDLQLQYGVRVDGAHFLNTPTFNPLVESTFGKRNDDVPTPVVFSPRIGFSWTLGNAQEIAAFTGAARAPRAVLRGGIGVQANAANSGVLSSVLTNTGLPNGIQQIVCTGPSAPIPNWDLYAQDPSLIPETCADGTSGSVFSNSAPNVSLIAKNFRPQKAVRSNLSWNGAILDARFTLNADISYSLNLNQQRFVDVNFAPNTRFTLSDGRPVFVDPASIVTTTGSIASRDARVSQLFNRVTETRSDLQSRTAQLQLRLSPIIRTPSNFGWSLAYTYAHIREEVSGFSSTADNPLEVFWARSGQGPHSINYNLRYRFFNAVNVSWNGSFRSGNAFTPTISGDVNGDGYFNDRAFVFAPTGGSDAAVAAGMQELLNSTSGRTRECLEKQIGSIARRNSCRGPWSSTASLSVSLDRAKFRMPQRGEISFSLSNPLGAADLLVNGSDHLRGWGQNPSTDQSLLYVRGFDPLTKQFKYEVNQRFGATQPQFVTLRSPVVLTAQVRIDLGPTRERQTLAQQLASGRTSPGSRFPESLYRSAVSNMVPNPMSTILRQQDSLRLTALQADSIASMNRRYNYRADSLWAPVAKYLAGLPKEYDGDAAYDRYLNARHAQIDMLTEIVPAIRELLTSEQRRKLPQFIVSYLDPRTLALIRNGTPMFINSQGGGLPPLIEAAGIGFAEAVFIAR